MNEIEQRWKFRDAAIALGIICVILVVSLAGVIVYYVSSVNGKDNTIQTDNNQINSLTSQVEDLNYIANLMDSEVLFNQSVSVQAGESIEYKFVANYSGFISVRMEGVNGSNLNSTWVGANSYRSVPGTDGIVLYDETKSLHGGLIDTEYFPVLQNNGSTAGVGVGNNGNQTITEWLIITYYY